MKHLDSIFLGKLLKRCRRYWRNETAYSISLPKYSQKSKAFILEKGLLPVQVNSIVNIAITLERHFNMPKPQSLRRGYHIYLKHGAKFDSYMKAWFGTRAKYLTPEKALKEQIARGFTKRIIPNPKFPYIASNVDKRYIWPKQYNKAYVNMGGVYEKMPLIGVTGHTSIKIPKRLF